MAQSTGKLSPVQDTDDTEHGIMHRMDNENMSTVERDMTAVTVCFIYAMYLLAIRLCSRYVYSFKMLYYRQELSYPNKP